MRNKKEVLNSINKFYNAMHKRKSLLPGIPALPEIEQ